MQEGPFFGHLLKDLGDGEGRAGVQAGCVVLEEGQDVINVSRRRRSAKH
jgi:hypothetical protein